jgi:hypothetical protein
MGPALRISKVKCPFSECQLKSTTLLPTRTCSRLARNAVDGGQIIHFLDTEKLAERLEG